MDKKINCLYTSTFYFYKKVDMINKIKFSTTKCLYIIPKNILMYVTKHLVVDFSIHNDFYENGISI